MANSVTASWQKLKETYSSIDDEQWNQYMVVTQNSTDGNGDWAFRVNYELTIDMLMIEIKAKFARAFGFFATSIVVMRNFGDLMAI